MGAGRDGGTGVRGKGWGKGVGKGRAVAVGVEGQPWALGQPRPDTLRYPAITRQPEEQKQARGGAGRGGTKSTRGRERELKTAQGQEKGIKLSASHN